jgi:hypothetical protein
MQLDERKEGEGTAHLGVFERIVGSAYEIPANQSFIHRCRTAASRGKCLSVVFF